MINIVTTLIRAINKNKSLIHAHIGQLGTDVHPDCDYRDSGFMNPKEKAIANNKGVTVPDGTDIFALEPGRYWGTSFKNAPAQVDKSMSIVDVYVVDSAHKVIDYYWINGRKNFRAYQSLTDNKPAWSTPIIGRKQALKNGAKGSVTMSVYRFDDNMRVKLNVDVSGLKLQPGGYIDVASVEFTKFYPETTQTKYAVGVKSGGGTNRGIELQITKGGNLRVINTEVSIAIDSCQASAEYTIDNTGALPDLNI